MKFKFKDFLNTLTNAKYNGIIHFCVSLKTKKEIQFYQTLRKEYISMQISFWALSQKSLDNCFETSQDHFLFNTFFLSE